MLLLATLVFLVGFLLTEIAIRRERENRKFEKRIREGLAQVHQSGQIRIVINALDDLERPHA